MDNRLGDIEVFLSAARAGSFAEAAKLLRLTPSAVSRSVARLEARLSVVLLRRTTRSLALTPEGEVYRDRMSALVADIADVESSLGQGGDEPRGLLRINASVPFGTQCLLPILPRFIERCPEVVVDLSLSDALVDLVEAKADVAIRIGPLRHPAAGEEARAQPMVLAASPGYLAARGEPQAPADLDGHRCLRFSFRRSVDTWSFRVGRRVMHRPVEGAFLGNSGEVVRLMAVAGGGIARLGRFHVAKDLRDGRLVALLERFNPGDGEDVHALYSAQDRLALRVRAFLDFLEASLVMEL